MAMQDRHDSFDMNTYYSAQCGMCIETEPPQLLYWVNMTGMTSAGLA